jgi:hypothetical protein
LELAAKCNKIKGTKERQIRMNLTYSKFQTFQEWHFLAEQNKSNINFVHFLKEIFKSFQIKLHLQVSQTLYFLAKNLMAFSENSFFDSNHKV